MFVRNFYRVRAAYQVAKQRELLGYYNSSRDFSLPKFTTVDGTVPTKYYDVGYLNSSFVPSFDYSTWISAMLNISPSIDVSSPIVSTGTNPTSYKPFSQAVFFGTGSISPTIDDYRLSGDTVTGYTSSNYSKDEYAEDGTFAKRTITYTITNNNTEPVTIGEIGIFICATWTTSRSSDKYIYTTYPYLLERTVLESPITIPAGGVGQVTYSITENYLEP